MTSIDDIANDNHGSDLGVIGTGVIDSVPSDAVPIDPVVTGDARLRAALEALLIVSDGPVKATDLVGVLGIDADTIEEQLDALQSDYRGDNGDTKHGFELKKSTRGWQFVNSREFEGLVAQFVNEGNSSRLSQASLEVLAVIAYKQPITRAQVNEIRGVNSEQVVRNLSVRGLVEDAGMDDRSNARLLKTTDVFLEKLGIEDIDSLPDLAPFLPARESIAFQAEFSEDQR